MKINVSGHKGYIGSHVWDSLENNSIEFKSELYLSGVDIVMNPRPIKNKIALIDLARQESDAFIHLAAKISVPGSYETPSDYVYTNLTLLDIILREVKTKHFIFISSVSVLEPNNPYSMTKLLGEHMVMKSGVPYTILRLSNVAGVNPKFKDKINNNHLIGAGCKAIKEGRPIEIFGQNYETFDGTCIRDYIHVEDVANIIARQAGQKARMETDFVYNGKQYSNLQIAKRIQRISNTEDIPILFKSRRINDVPIYNFPQEMGSYGPVKDIDTIIKSVYNNIQ